MPQDNLSCVQELTFPQKDPYTQEPDLKYELTKMLARLKQAGPQQELNLSYELTKLFALKETHLYGKMDEATKEIAQTVETMELVQKFVTEITRRQIEGDTDRISFLNAEDQKLIDKLRSHPEFESHFPPGKYEWKGKKELESLSGLKESLEKMVEGSLSRKINFKADEVTLIYQLVTQLMLICGNILKNSGDLIRTIQHNTGKN